MRGVVAVEPALLPLRQDVDFLASVPAASRHLHREGLLEGLRQPVHVDGDGRIRAAMGESVVVTGFESLGKLFRGAGKQELERRGDALARADRASRPVFTSQEWGFLEPTLPYVRAPVECLVPAPSSVPSCVAPERREVAFAWQAHAALAVGYGLDPPAAAAQQARVAAEGRRRAEDAVSAGIRATDTPLPMGADGSLASRGGGSASQTAASAQDRAKGDLFSLFVPPSSEGVWRWIALQTGVARVEDGPVVDSFRAQTRRIRGVFRPVLVEVPEAVALALQAPQAVAARVEAVATDQSRRTRGEPAAVWPSDRV